MSHKIDHLCFLCQILLAVILLLGNGISVNAQCSVEQSFKLLVDDGAADHWFGEAVAISGTTAIVGAASHNHNGASSGSAYLFDTTTGEQLVQLFADDGTADDWFGRSVSIDGTTVVVGAHRDDDNGSNSGSAYLFDTTTGQQITKLLADDGDVSDFFGTSVSISGETAIAGAFFHDGARGAAYLFDSTTGQQTAKLQGSEPAWDDYFGRSVRISGTTAIVGADGEDDNGQDSGAAYLFDTTTGQQIFKLFPDDGAVGDWFGWSVDISGTIAIVAAPRDDDNGENSGSAYLFDATTGQQVFKLLAEDCEAGDSFGSSVAISGTTAIIGAPRDDDNGSNSGSVYLFDTTTGQQIAKLWPNDAAQGDEFGGEREGVAIYGNVAIVGAFLDDDNGSGSGSAYLFDISCSNSQVVNADAFLVTRGSYVSGGIPELAASDNADLSLRRATSDIQSRTEFEVTAVSSVASPSSLEVTLEGSVFARSTVNQSIELFDYVAGSWNQVDARAASRFSDATATVPATGDLSRFVEAETMCLKARIRYQSLNPRQQFSSNTDHFIWTISQ